MERSVTTRINVLYRSEIKLFYDFCTRNDFEATNSALEEWLNLLLAEGYSASTIRKRFYGVKKLLLALHDEKEFENENARILSEYNLKCGLQQIKLPKRSAFIVDPTKILSEDDVRLLYQKSKPKIGLIIEFLFVTGVRNNELVNIRRKHVKEISNDCYSIQIMGKGIKQRTVYINSGLRRRIRDTFKSKEFLFETRNHTKYDRQHICLMISRAGKKILNRKITPHYLRHSFCTHLIKTTNNDVRSVSAYMGHSAQWTTQIYNHSTLDPKSLKGLWDYKKGRRRQNGIAS